MSFPSVRRSGVIFLPELLDFFDDDGERLMDHVRLDGFPVLEPMPAPAGYEGKGQYGWWYRHDVEEWFANKVIEQLQVSVEPPDAPVLDADINQRWEEWRREIADEEDRERE